MIKLLINALPLFLLLTLINCMGQKNELPVYSREIAIVDNLVIEEELLRFKIRLEINKLPEGVFDLTKPQELRKNKDFDALLTSTLNKMIDDYTVIAYAEKEGIKIPPDEISKKISERKKRLNPKTFDNLLREKNIPYSRWKQVIESEVKVQYILDKELAKGLKVSLGEIKSYYRRNNADYIVPERVRVRQIVTDSLEKAREVHERILKGENFAKLAVNHSLSPDRAQGGDLGFFAKGSFPKEFDDACFKLKKGAVSPIVKSDYGYHIFKLLDRLPPGRKPLLEAATEIHQKLFEEKLKKKYDAWMVLARSKVNITIYKNVLDAFFL